jgi:hypothetical protein
MDQNFFADTLRAFKHRTPFRPFTVVTVSGQRHEVDHPDALAVRGGVALFVGPGSVPVIFDHESVDEVVGDLAGNPADA